jgi:hypothetical protein
LVRRVVERGIARQVWDDESSRARGYQAPPDELMEPGAMAPPPAPPMGGMAAFAKPMAAPMPGRGATIIGAPPQQRAAPAAPETKKPPSEPPAPMPRLDYAALVMLPPASAQRGRLVAAPRAIDPAVAAGVTSANDALARLALPPGCRDGWPHAYDHAFVADGAVDVRADGAWQSIAVTSRSGTAKLRHVAVPREQADVFRIAALANPLDGPLLPGPIDVYDRGTFLVTGEVDYTPPGGSLELGLGVDPQVKIARNVEFHEEVVGMLRGALRLVHAISIDIDNLSPRAIELEVRERVPVTRDGDDDVEVLLGRVDPAWERWTPDADAPAADRLRGGYRWRIALPPSAKRLLRAAYELKIAAKHELVGGNRRES